jgi:hypothetical protein
VEYGSIPEAFIEKELFDIRAVTLEAIDTEGHPNECATRIAEVTAPVYDEDKTETRQEDAISTSPIASNTQ